MSLVEINNVAIGIKEYEGKRVITFKDIEFTGMNLYIEHLPFDVTAVKYITDYDKNNDYGPGARK